MERSMTVHRQAHRLMDDAWKAGPTCTQPRSRWRALRLGTRPRTSRPRSCVSLNTKITLSLYPRLARLRHARAHRLGLGPLVRPPHSPPCRSPYAASLRPWQDVEQPSDIRCNDASLEPRALIRADTRGATSALRVGARSAQVSVPCVDPARSSPLPSVRSICTSLYRSPKLED